MDETHAPLHPRRAGEIRGPRHERLVRRGDGCGFEVVISQPELVKLSTFVTF